MALTREQVVEKIQNDPDFINIKRFGYSLDRLCLRYQEGCSNRTISQALLVPEDKVDELYEETVQMLRKIMDVRS